MTLFVLWIGKLTYVLLRLLGKRGATLPGLIVERMSPGFLAAKLAILPGGVVVVTGTNGKTTSTKMLTHILSADRRVLTNPTGSNFTRGVIASIVQHSNWLGKLNYDIAVIELDEAYAAKFSGVYSPDYCLALNVMRDQMDRFGEIDYTAKLISKVVNKTTKVVVLNANDERISAMAKHAQAQVEYFGVAPKLRDLFRNDDELHGGATTQSKINPLAELTSLNAGFIGLELAGKNLKIPFNITGTYNAQNAVAVIAMAHCLGISVDKITAQITTARPAFGRGESFNVGQKKVILQLVKNPGGFRQSLLGGSKLAVNHVLIAINDDYADGRDVSWLWDVDFSSLVGTTISTTGVRAADMALRLGYDGVAVAKVNSNPESSVMHAINQVKPGGLILIYSTYTAMLAIRKVISKITEVEKV